MKVSRKTQKLQKDVLKTNRIGCGCALVLLLALVLTMILAAFFSKPNP